MAGKADGHHGIPGSHGIPRFDDVSLRESSDHRDRVAWSSDVPWQEDEGASWCGFEAGSPRYGGL